MLMSLKGSLHLTANPKSAILGIPELVMKILAGFRSR